MTGEGDGATATARTAELQPTVHAADDGWDCTRHPPSFCGSPLGGSAESSHRAYLVMKFPIIWAGWVIGFELTCFIVASSSSGLK